uniref:Ig-like domain-containing protein n=1 Tax=Panagrolaimus superbus TaxID=310955 RepID=A0A914Z2S4_9BILA
MPSAPRFTQRPSIQQTATGDLLMECHLEADPPPDVRWSHGGTPILASGRVSLTLTNLNGNLYKATLVIKEPSAGDGGAYKCTASNQLGESNANINLNFAGGDERAPTPSQKGPTFVGKPRIIPKEGGALILMECKVKSTSRPTAKWSKDGVPLGGGNFKDVFTDLGDNVYLCQLEIRKPSAGDAGQYRCNIKNEQGETNANLSLNFQQEEAPSEGRRSPSVGRKSPRPRTPSSRPETPSKRHREGTPSKRKSREGSPRKSVRSRTSTPTQDIQSSSTLQVESASSRKTATSKTEKMEITTTEKRKSDAGLPPAPKRGRSRSKSPAVGGKTAATDNEFKRTPVIMEPLKSKIKVASSGETVVLQCELQCHTSTKITWFKDNQIIESRSQYSSTFDGKVARLSISRMSKDKAGLYKCEATSDYGNTQTSAVVKFFESLDVSRKEETTKRKSVTIDENTVPEKQRAGADRTSRSSNVGLKAAASEPSPEEVKFQLFLPILFFLLPIFMTFKIQYKSVKNMEALNAEGESDNDTPIGDYIPMNDSFTNIPKIQFSPVNSVTSRSSSESDISSISSKSSKFSHIHNYVIASLPSGNAKRNILGGIIDFDTP